MTNTGSNLTKDELIKELEVVRKELEEAKVEMETQQWGLEKTNKALRSLYKKLEDKNAELLKFDQLKSDFVSVVSHELRTPLAISTEGISLILDGLAGDITDKQKELLETSLENLRRLNRIIDDLLDISKIEAGKVDLELTFTDIVKLVDENVDNYKRVVLKKNINLSSSLPDKEIMISVDRDKIIQVLNNLLNNATKFTPNDGSINVFMQETEGEVVIGVKDTGIGIAEENLPKLFGKFEQFGRQEGPGIKGTGLGLSISKSIVEMHHGKIWAESKLKEGTTIYFALPTHDTSKHDFDELFDNLIKDGHYLNKPLVLIVAYLRNFDFIRKEYGEEMLNVVMNELLLAINKVYTRPDDKVILYNIQSIFSVLPETNKLGGMAMIARIKESIDQCKFEFEGNPIPVDLKLGISIFPFDGKDRKELIDSALNNIAREKHILIVDDHPQIFRILQSRLKEENYHLYSASDGEQAMIAVKERQPDLIILDIMMPRMNGYEVLGRLKENENTASIPIIILTAKNVENVKEESMGFGKIPVISKTGGFDRLIKMIRNTI